jgi:hypothetical protein
MKVTRILAFLIALSSQQSLCQDRDTLIYDPTMENYTIWYRTKIPYARKADGSLRRLSRDDSLLEGETYIQKDTILSTVLEPTTKIEPEVRCSVTFDETSRSFTYFYSVKNEETSRQDLLEFTVGYGKQTAALGADGTMWFGGQQYEPGADRLLNSWSWLAAGPGTSPIKPGSSVEGFRLISSAAPGVSVAYFAGKRSIFAEFVGGLSNQILQRTLDELDVFPAGRVIRKTVAPIAPEAGLTPTDLLDTLTSYKHQALTLGWITNQGIANSLDQKLENARKQLDRGNNKAAKNVLQAFVNEVEAQKDKHLTSEAYALLKFNAEYLLSKH